MSYSRPNTGDPELDRKLIAEDFAVILPNLQSATTDLHFSIWLDKLALVDRQAIIAYLREHWNELPRNQRMIAHIRLKDMRDEPID